MTSHSRHLIVNVPAVQQMDTAVLGEVFRANMEKALDPPYLLLVEFRNYPSPIAFFGASCDCADFG